MPRTAAVPLLLSLLARRRDTTEVVVHRTIDTLGAEAADQGAWCDTLAAHGLDAACVPGALPPSTWTYESLARMLWPEMNVGEAELNPPCETTGAVIGDRDGASPWTRESDEVFQASEDLDEAVTAPEGDLPVRDAINTLLRETADGAGVVAFLNDYRAGGHGPRCWYATDDPRCDAMWAFATRASPKSTRTAPSPSPSRACGGISATRTPRWTATRWTPRASPAGTRSSPPPITARPTRPRRGSTTCCPPSPARGATRICASSSRPTPAFDDYANQAAAACRVR